MSESLMEAARLSQMTLRKKLYDRLGYRGVELHGLSILIADHVDALSARLAALEKRTPDFGPFVEVCEELRDTPFAFNDCIPVIGTRLVKIGNALLAGADVPSSEGVKKELSPDERADKTWRNICKMLGPKNCKKLAKEIRGEPDLEGEAMTPDYEQLKDDEPEPSHPWRVPSKVTCRLECLQCGGKDEQCCFCDGSGLIDMVDVKSANRELEEQLAKPAEQTDCCPVHAKAVEPEWNPDADDNDAIGCQAKYREPDHPWREVAEECVCRINANRYGPHAPCKVYIEDADIIESAIEKAVGQAADSVFSVSACNQKLVKERDELKAEVARLKAAKPKVEGLTREEIEGCWRANPQKRSFTNPTATIDAILALQAKKAAEIEGEVSDE